MILRYLGLTLLLIISPLTEALQAYGVQAAYSEDLIIIESDLLTFDKGAQRATFSGRVEIRFQDLTIKTSLVSVDYDLADEKRKIKFITVPYKLIGRYATPKSVIRGDDDAETIFIASSALYNPNRCKLILEGEVYSSYKERIFQSDKLEYYTGSCRAYEKHFANQRDN
jgi:lipopolysaccharide export system protein LptA